MTPELAISLLKKGTTGDEILKILDSLAENPDDLIVAIGRSSNWHKVD
jgi:predicted alternative tryptophan synthase beta-subunit